MRGSTPAEHCATIRERAHGQTIVEFALVIPFIFVFFMGVIEMAVGLNASLTVNRASQAGAHLAATAGNLEGADCLILEKIETDVTVPNDDANIIRVQIHRMSLTGDTIYATQTWTRSGSTACDLAGGASVVVPYTLTEAGYPEAQRCNVLTGCPTLTPSRSTVDNIGVTVQYRHDFVTPLNGVIGLVASSGGSGGSWTFEQRNIFRMEPVL